MYVLGGYFTTQQTVFAPNQGQLEAVDQYVDHQNVVDMQHGSDQNNTTYVFVYLYYLLAKIERQRWMAIHDPKTP